MANKHLAHFCFDQPDYCMYYLCLYQNFTFILLYVVCVSHRRYDNVSFLFYLQYYAICLSYQLTCRFGWRTFTFSGCIYFAVFWSVLYLPASCVTFLYLLRLHLYQRRCLIECVATTLWTKIEVQLPKGCVIVVSYFARVWKNAAYLVVQSIDVGRIKQVWLRQMHYGDCRHCFHEGLKRC